MEALRPFRQDFLHYAPRALHIRDKGGRIIQLRLNKAQLYAHHRITDQLEATGRVRALILKGRQQGLCLDPETRVLTADLRWVALKTVKPGQRLVACDEHTEETDGRSKPRRMRTAVVEKVWKTPQQPAYRITFEDGRSVICSGAHRWLSRKSQPDPAWRSIDGSADPKSKLKPGDLIRAIVAPWTKGDLDDAWFGGVLDGEGSFDYKKRTGADMAVSQVAGPVLSRMLEHCTKKGYRFCVVSDDGPRRTKFGLRSVHAISISNIPDNLRLIGQARPVRWIGEEWWDGKRLPHGGWCRIAKIERLGERKLIDLQTSTGTFIAEGFVSHNSTYTEGRFYWKTSLNPGQRALILTHLQDSTDLLFAMTKRYHDNCPQHLQPATQAASAKELAFGDLGSGFGVATAGSRAVGRGDTIQFFHGCLGLEVPVVSSTGRLVRVKDVEVGQELITHTGKAAKVSFISEQVKSVFEVRLKGLRSLPLVATGEHRFWTRDGWRELKDIEPGDCIGYPVRDISGLQQSLPFRLPDAVRPQGGGRRETGPDNVLATFELGRILGLYLAEGSVAYQSKAPHAPASVTFSVHEREVARTEAWLAALPRLFTSVKTRAQKGTKTVTVTVYGRSFASFVLRLCGAVATKQLPAEWGQYPKPFVEGLCLGYLAGDGHSSKREYDRRISASSIRSAITLGVREALAALGYGWAGIQHQGAAQRNGRKEQEKWTLRLTGRGVDAVCEKLGWDMPPRRRAGAYGEVEVKDGYAWVPVLSKEAIGEQTVRDFEMDHVDHSYCTVHGASHNSELAFWNNAADHMAGVGQAVPDLPGTEIILESTANGTGNEFHQRWQDAERGVSDYIAIFIPWFWQDEYRLPVPSDFVMDAEEAEYAELYDVPTECIVWRRKKLRNDFRGDVALFNQEYPATPALAFRRVTGDPLIPVEYVARARKAEASEEGPPIMGVDPAEYGDDDSCMSLRKGRSVPVQKRWHGRGPMELVGLIAAEADRLNPVMINVDCTGVGSGVADRLIELGYPVNRIHFGSRPLEPEQYVLRRDEMWGLMRAWFLDIPCSIPDDDALESDLVSPQYSYDSSRRLKLESKESMRKRGLKSPDAADSLALTFAVPINAAANEAKAFRAARRNPRDWRT